VRIGSDRVAGISLALTLASILSACHAGGKAPGAKASGAKALGVRVSPGHVQARAQVPPPSSTTSQTFIGNGKTSVKTANATDDIDRYWVQKLDIDGDGTAEQAALLWDDEDRVLFAYAETDVPCAGGGTAVVGLLVCVNGQGNLRARPAGSGFYVMYLDAMECGAAVAGLFGCSFNERGEAIECGTAAIDEAGDAIRITGGQK
jgi:hypothetical protein